VTGVPLEHLLGWAAFGGQRVAVTDGVFVPRRRSELVVREALRALAEQPGRRVVVDLCCGSGAIGAAVVAAGFDIELHAADIDPVAVECARRTLDGRGRVHCGDLYDALPEQLAGRVDVIAVNSPYVPTAAIATMPSEARDHEPALALDGGPDGLAVHRRVAVGAPRWLAPGGVLVLETSEPQAEASRRLASSAGFTATVVRSAEIGATVVVARNGGS
jgi:release factor glutamine methyltransferase